MVNPPEHQRREWAQPEQELFCAYAEAIWDDLDALVTYDFERSVTENGGLFAFYASDNEMLLTVKVRALSYEHEYRDRTVDGYGLFTPPETSAPFGSTGRQSMRLRDLFPSEGSVARAALVRPAFEYAGYAMEAETYRRQPASAPIQADE